MEVLILTNFTSDAHLLVGEPLKVIYPDFHASVLQSATWVTWHGRLKGPYPKGWRIRRENLSDLTSLLAAYNIPYQTRAYLEPRKVESKPSAYMELWYAWVQEDVNRAVAYTLHDASHIELKIRDNGEEKVYAEFLLEDIQLSHEVVAKLAWEQYHETFSEENLENIY